MTSKDYLFEQVEKEDHDNVDAFDCDIILFSELEEDEFDEHDSRDRVMDVVDFMSNNFMGYYDADDI